MFVFGNLLLAIAYILGRLLWLYSIVVLIAVLISWVSPDPSNPVVRFLRAATEPAFEWVRRHLPFAVIGMIDLSPIIVFMAIGFLQTFLVGSLEDLALRLR